MLFQMLDLNYYDLLDGITASLIVFFSVSFAIIVYWKAIKIDAKLLKYGALMGLFAGLLWLGPCSDFLCKIFLNQNISPVELYGILSYMWVAPSLIMAIYIGTELLIPNKKKIILVIYSILGIIFELFLFLATKESFEFRRSSSGELIDARFVYGHPTFILIAIFLISILVINGFGAMRRSFQTTGTIRKRFRLMSITFFLFVLVGTLDALLLPGPILFITRMGMIVCAFLLYFALKP